MSQRNVKNYKSIKVPTWIYENGRRAENELIARGLNSLPRDLLEPSSCPICGALLETFKVKYQYVRCPNCCYRQQTLSVASGTAAVGAAIGLGAVLGLGLSLLFRELFKSKEERG